MFSAANIILSVPPPKEFWHFFIFKAKKIRFLTSKCMKSTAKGGKSADFPVRCTTRRGGNEISVCLLPLARTINIYSVGRVELSACE